VPGSPAGFPPVARGWYPDPAGRAATRFHDGTRWTEQVADAHGRTAVEPVPFAASMPQAPASYPPRYPSAPQWAGQPGPYGPVPPRSSASPVPFVLGYVVGLAVLAAGIFLLPWGKGDHDGFLDLYKAITRADDAGVDIPGALKIYVEIFIWLVSGALAAVGGLILFARRSTVGSSLAKAAMVLICIYGLLLHVFAGNDLTKGPTTDLSDLGAGYWAVGAGYLVLAGVAVARRLPLAPPAGPYGGRHAGRHGYR
jgi:hypothetical protein